MKYKLFTGLFVFFVSSALFVAICPAFTTPSTISVTKPTPGDTFTVCASSCNFTSMTLADTSGSVGPGDVVQVKAGTYSAFNWTNSSGTSGNEIVIEPFGDGTVYFDGETHLGGAFPGTVKADYIIVDGGTNKDFVFKSTAVPANVLGIWGDYITLRRVVIQGPTGNCYESDNSGLAIGSPISSGYTPNKYYTPGNFKVYNITIRDMNHKGIYIHGAVSGEIKNNIIWNTEGNGIQMNPRGGHWIDGLEIKGNAIYENGPCDDPTDPAIPDGFFSKSILISGMSSAQGANPYMRNIVVSNNLIWNNVDLDGIDVNAPTGFYILDAADPGYELKIYNNTIYGMGRYGIRVTSKSTNNEVSIRNNILYDNNKVYDTSFVGGMSINSGVTVDTGNNASTNPTFVNSTYVNDGTIANGTDGNFLKLRLSSNAINQGTSLNSEGTAISTDIGTSDYFGNTRPNLGGYDIGAFEYTVEPPTSLTAP